jgi:hypothetical protein
MKIEVHHLARNPTAAWNELSKIQKVIKVQVSPPESSVADDKVSRGLLPSAWQTYGTNSVSTEI